MHWSRLNATSPLDGADPDDGVNTPAEGERGMIRAVRVRWLEARVHFDAFRFDPLGYLQGVAWRLRGLRLRSRHRFGALMGRSPLAYELWIARVERGLFADLLRDPPPDRVPSILVVVDCVGEAGSAPATLRSLEGAGPVNLVGIGCHESSGRSLSKPADLSGIVDEAGTWVCAVAAGDQLTLEGLAIYARAAATANDAWVIYSDDDLIDGARRSAPHFKPSWNSDLFKHHDFVTGAAIIRVTPEMVSDAAGPDWMRQVTRRAIQRGSEPLRLPVVLHHRRRRPQPSLPAKQQPIVPPDAPTVSIIVPTRDRLAYLRNCIEGVRRTNYPAFEIVVIDNESSEPETIDYLRELELSGVRVLEVRGAFNFSALNNLAVEHAQGELLCFLNNDVEFADPHWLALLVHQAIRPELGAVGARLLYPDRSIQHAGVVTGVGGGAAHAHRFVREDENGYFLRHWLPQKVSAVTAACLVVEKRKFLAVGGFDAEQFPVAFNDVDLCLKLNAAGWHSFYEPRATLVHHESKSRGSDRSRANRARFAGELAALKLRWGTDRERDPFHHPQLSPFCEQFHIAV